MRKNFLLSTKWLPLSDSTRHDAQESLSKSDEHDIHQVFFRLVKINWTGYYKSVSVLGCTLIYNTKEIWNFNT